MNFKFLSCHFILKKLVFSHLLNTRLFLSFAVRRLVFPGVLSCRLVSLLLCRPTTSCRCTIIQCSVSFFLKYCSDVGHSIKYLFEQLIFSPAWQERCVGLFFRISVGRMRNPNQFSISLVLLFGHSLLPPKFGLGVLPYSAWSNFLQLSFNFRESIFRFLLLLPLVIQNSLHLLLSLSLMFRT